MTLEVAPYIVAARSAHDVPSLRRYVEERAARDDVLFLGIFTPDGATHVGNVKYEPINEHEGFTVMGILIGDRAWRGRGVAEEVIVASARWLQAHRGIPGKFSSGWPRITVLPLRPTRRSGSGSSPARVFPWGKTRFAWFGIWTHRCDAQQQTHENVPKSLRSSLLCRLQSAHRCGYALDRLGGTTFLRLRIAGGDMAIPATLYRAGGAGVYAHLCSMVRADGGAAGGHGTGRLRRSALRGGPERDALGAPVFCGRWPSSPCIGCMRWRRSCCACA